MFTDKAEKQCYISSHCHSSFTDLNVQKFWVHKSAAILCTPCRGAQEQVQGSWRTRGDPDGGHPQEWEPVSGHGDSSGAGPDPGEPGAPPGGGGVVLIYKPLRRILSCGIGVRPDAEILIHIFVTFRLNFVMLCYMVCWLYKISAESFENVSPRVRERLLNLSTRFWQVSLLVCARMCLKVLAEAHSGKPEDKWNAHLKVPVDVFLWMNIFDSTNYLLSNF